MTGVPTPRRTALPAEHVRRAEVTGAAAGLVDLAGEAAAAAVLRYAEDVLDRGVQAAGLGPG